MMTMVVCGDCGCGDVVSVVVVSRSPSDFADGPAHFRFGSGLGLGREKSCGWKRGKLRGGCAKKAIEGKAEKKGGWESDGKGG